MRHDIFEYICSSVIAYSYKFSGFHSPLLSTFHGFFHEFFHRRKSQCTPMWIESHEDNNSLPPLQHFSQRQYKGRKKMSHIYQCLQNSHKVHLTNRSFWLLLPFDIRLLWVGRKWSTVGLWLVSKHYSNVNRKRRNVIAVTVELHQTKHLIGF